MHLDIGEEVNYIAHTTLVQLRTGIVTWQYTSQFGVLLLYQQQRIINGLSNLRSMRLLYNVTPTGTLRYKEDSALVCTFVFILIFRVCIFIFLQFLILRLKLIADILQEYLSQHHTLLL